MQKNKRFYKMVNIIKSPKGWSIALDNKPIKTAAKNELAAPTEKIASMIQSEWSAQDTHIDPETMPITQLVSTKIDRVTFQRDEICALTLKYLDTDLICYRSPTPPELKAKQSEIWDRWIDWTEKEYGARLQTTEGLSALNQPASLHKKIHKQVFALDNDHFTILQLITSATGSLVLALAFIKSEITPDEIYEAIRIEETFKAGLYNEEKHGADPAQEEKEYALIADIKSARAYLDAL